MTSPQKPPPPTDPEDPRATDARTDESPSLHLDPESTSTDLFLKGIPIDRLADLAVWLAGKAPEEVSTLDSPLARVILRVPDKVFCLRFHDQPPLLLHVEFQLRGDPSMGERTAMYAILLRRYQRSEEFRGCRISSVVIYLDPAVYTEDPGRFEIVGDPDLALSFSYRVVKLWELDPEPFLVRDAPGLWPFVPLMRGNPEELLVQSKERIVGAPESLLPLEQKRDLLAITGGLAARVVKDKKALDRLILEIEDMGGNYVFDTLVERGRQQGREEGRVEAARSHVLRFLRRRFGDVGEEIPERLAAIKDTGILDTLVEDAADVPSLEAFIARMRG